MGNEMGNNNASGLREEEDNTSDKAQGKSVQEPVNANVIKEDTIEGSTKGNHEGRGMDSDDPELSKHAHAHNHTSDETEQEYTGPHSPAGSPKDGMESNEVGGGHTEFRLNKLQVYEEPTKSNLEEKAGSNQLEKQASLNKEQEDQVMPTSTFISISPSESQELTFSQHKFIANADRSVKYGTSSPKPSEDNLRPIAPGKNGHILHTGISDKLDGVHIPGINLDVEEKRGDLSKEKMASKEDTIRDEEKFEVELQNETQEDFNKTTGITSDNQSDQGESCDEEFTSEINCCANNLSESQPEKANLLKPHIELSVPEDKCVVVAEETELTRQESEREVRKHYYNLSQLREDSVRESEIDWANISQIDSLEQNCKNNAESSVNVSHDPDSNGSFQVGVAKVGENGYHIDLFNVSQNGAFEDSCVESEGDNMIAPELGRLPEELSMSNGEGNEEETNCILEEEKSTEKQMVTAIKEKIEVSYATGEEQKTRELLQSNLLSVQAKAHPLPAPTSHFLSQYEQQEFIKESKDAQDSNNSTLELKPESFIESFAGNASTDQATSMNTVRNSVSAFVLTIDTAHKDAPHSATLAPEIVRETKSSAVQQYEKVETNIFASDGYEAQESIGRLSTESNPENINAYAQMRKSPSFNLDLRIKAKGDESDQTPLLYQDNTAIECFSNQVDVSLQSPALPSLHNQVSLRYQAMPVAEKVIPLERTDSEKSRTSFLGFLKEEEGSDVVVTPQKQDNHAAAKKTTKDFSISPAERVASDSPKSKEKHKRRTSLLGQCICCATVIN